jgi:hypothetical protein
MTAHSQPDFDMMDKDRFVNETDQREIGSLCLPQP